MATIHHQHWQAVLAETQSLPRPDDSDALSHVHPTRPFPSDFSANSAPGPATALNLRSGTIVLASHAETPGGEPESRRVRLMAIRS